MKRLIIHLAFATLAIFCFCSCGRTPRQRLDSFEQVRDYSQGRAAVLERDGDRALWGFVDAEGKLVIECQYEAVGDFSEGLAAAKLPGGEYGYLDLEGRWKVQPAYRNVGTFEGGFAWVMNPSGLYGRVNSAGKEVIKCLYDRMPESYAQGLIKVHAEDLWGLLRESGEVFAVCAYQSIERPDSLEWIRVKRDGLWGLLNSDGGQIAECRYDSIGSVLGVGLIPAIAESKRGFLSKNGAEIVPCIFSYISDFKGGYARVNIGGDLASPASSASPERGLWGLIDTLGRELVAPKYRKLGVPSESLVAFVGESSELFGYLDLSGNVAITPRYAVAHPFTEGVAVVSYDGLGFGLIDHNGGEQSSFRYKSLGQLKDGRAPFNIDPHGAIFMGMSRRCGYLDSHGREAIGLRFDQAQEFSELRAAVMRYGLNSEDFMEQRWGYINTSGQMITDYKYHEAHPFSCGLARVFIKGAGYGFIDRKGREVVPCKYTNAADFKDFRARVVLDSREIMLDESGQIVGGHHVE